MSDADPEAVTLAADGITVRKTVDTEQFQTLAVVIELASERDEAARVQLVDRIPEDVSMEDVGFHPNYGSEHWSVEDRSVAFERDFEPGETYTTIYGIRDYPLNEVEALRGEPTLELVESSPEDLDDVVDEERSEAVRNFISGEADLPGLEGDLTGEAAEAAAAAAEAVDTGSTADADETEAAEVSSGPQQVPETEEAIEASPEVSDEPAAEAGPSEEPEPEPAAEPAEPAEVTDETAVEEAPAAEEVSAGEGADEREVRVPLTGGVVRVLIKELREGDVDPEDKRMLRDELVGREGSTDARISHLQQRVSDLEAYADALEAFIDEEGSAEEVISGLRDDVSSVEREVRAVDDRLDEVIEEVGQYDDRLESVADDVATLASREEVLADRLEDVEDDVAAQDDRVDDLGARIDQVSTDLDRVDDSVGDASAQVGELRDEVQSLRRDLRSEVQDLQADLEDFEAFRQRLSSAFGGGSFGDESGGED